MLDSVLIAYRLAEDARVRLPVIVNLDGFYLSFTREPVEIPDVEAVQVCRASTPERSGSAPASPISQAVAVLGGSPYSYFRYETHLAPLQAPDGPTTRSPTEFAGASAAAIGAGRGLPLRRRRDRVLHDRLALPPRPGGGGPAARGGLGVGLVRPRLLRPYPDSPPAPRCWRASVRVAVIDQNLSMGKGGVLALPSSPPPSTV